MKHRIYLASSWRNLEQRRVLWLLRDDGHEVYDFRNPAPGDGGFGWAKLESGDAASWTLADYRRLVTSHPSAREGFNLDKAALDWCDTCVLLLPCGRNAHLEAGYAIGQGKRTFFHLSADKFEPELMYLLGHGMAIDDAELLELVNS